MSSISEFNTLDNPFVKKLAASLHTNDFNGTAIELKKAEEDAKKWANELASANHALSIEKKLHLEAERKLFKAENDLKKLRAENPHIILKNQQTALQIALKSLSDNKKKTVIGAVEMMTIGITLSALAITTLQIASSDLFLTLLNFKTSTILGIGTVVGSSGLIGWKADKKAALTTRMDEDSVRASKTAINNSKIRCQDYTKQVNQKIAEIKSAQHDLENANDRIRMVTERVHSIELNLNKANKVIDTQNHKYANNINTTFSKTTMPLHKLESTDASNNDVKHIRSSITPA